MKYITYTLVAVAALVLSGCSDMLDTVTHAADQLLALVARPGISWLLIAMVCGEVAKRYVFTKERAVNGKPRWLWLWARRLLPLHAAAAGLVLGIFLPEGPLYYGGLGVIASVLFHVLQRFGKRWDLDIRLPGSSEPPR